MLSENALIILKDRYLQKGETPEDLFRRVAKHIAGAEKKENQKEWEDKFYNLMYSLKFLPNSPTLVNAGTGKGCLSACFTISPEDNMTSIMKTATDAAMIEKWGGGIGFGFSQLRPKGDEIKTVQGQACGPVSVMKLYSQVGKTLTQGAFRQGAHMGQLIVSHPNIQDFIHCKDSDNSLENFNISVQAPDEFMNAVEKDADWNFVNPRNGKVTKTIKAKDLWNEICESAWKTGDPGIAFIDRVWETAPNPQLGKIQTSNPCGEQWLENYGSCTLGSIDLSKHLNGKGTDFDWTELEKSIRTAVRFLDNVVEVNEFPLEELRVMNLKTRRIGLGVMGLADVLVLLGIAYDSDKAFVLCEKVAGFINEISWKESENLAKERGIFSEYKNSALESGGMSPVRNSSVTNVAPTGTVSRIAGCSSGIEPHFAIAWWSNVLWKDHLGTSTRLLDTPESVKNALEKKLGKEKAFDVLTNIANTPELAKKILTDNGITASHFRTANDISPDDHVKMQAVWQKYVSNSISKTINLSNSATVEDISNAFVLAWKSKCKCVTVYRDGSKSMQVLETGIKKKKDRVIVERPKEVEGKTKKIITGHGNMYVTVNYDAEGKPFEIFSALGKAGGCDSAQIEAISRLVSLGLRSGISHKDIAKQLGGITCCPVWDDGDQILSVPDAIAHVLGYKGGKIGYNNNKDNFCKSCQGVLIQQEGCLSCQNCGWSKCD